MAHRHKVQERNVGGGVEASSKGKKIVMSTAASKKESFNRGGKVPGFKSGGRLDKRARGGGTKSPFSSAKTSEKGNLTYSGGTKARP